MFKRALVILIVLNAIGFAIYGAARHREGNRAIAAAEKDKVTDAAGANNVERQGVMSKDEYLRFLAIGDVSFKTGVISDADFKYLISQTRDPHASSASPGRFHEVAAMSFISMTKYTSEQKEEMMQAVVPLIRSQSPLDEKVGLDVAAHLRDARAVADALPLAQSPDIHVQHDAQKYLAAAGYRQVR